MCFLLSMYLNHPHAPIIITTSFTPSSPPPNPLCVCDFTMKRHLPKQHPFTSHELETPSPHQSTYVQLPQQKLWYLKLVQLLWVLGRLTKKGKLSHGFLSQLHSEEVFRWYFVAMYCPMPKLFETSWFRPIKIGLGKISIVAAPHWACLDSNAPASFFGTP